MTAWMPSAHMIDTREKAHAERLPRADALLASDAPAKLLAARAAIDSRLTAIETGADVAALGTAEERAQWAKVRALEAALNDATGIDADELQTDRDKMRLMKGVLYWKLDAQFKERSYAERRELRALDALLNEAQNRWVRVQHARSSVPTNTGEFEARITALAQRIANLKSRLGQSAQMQNQYLEQLASTALLEQKDRLAAYEVQARFALADIYDRASSPPPRRPPRRQRPPRRRRPKRLPRPTRPRRLPTAERRRNEPAAGTCAGACGAARLRWPGALAAEETARGDAEGGNDCRPGEAAGRGASRRDRQRWLGQGDAKLS